MDSCLSQSTPAIFGRMDAYIEFQNHRIGGGEDIRTRFRRPLGVIPDIILDENDTCGLQEVRASIGLRIRQTQEVHDVLNSPIFQEEEEGAHDLARFMGFQKGLVLANATEGNALLIETFERFSGRNMQYVGPKALHRSLQGPLAYSGAAPSRDLSGIPGDLPLDSQGSISRGHSDWRFSWVNSHRDFAKLFEKMDRLKLGSDKMLLLEGIYSADGQTYEESDIPYLKDLLVKAKSDGFVVAVDISHDALLRFTNLFKAHNLTEWIDIAVMSGSKAKGGGPAYIFFNNESCYRAMAADDKILFSNGPSVIEVATDAELLRVHKSRGNEDGLRSMGNANHLVKVLQASGLPTSWTPQPDQLYPSSIVFIPIGHSDPVTFKVRDYLFSEGGIAMAPFLYPAVARDGGLRACCHPNLTEAQISSMPDRIEAAFTRLAVDLPSLLLQTPYYNRKLHLGLISYLDSKGLPVPPGGVKGVSGKEYYNCS